MQCHLKKRIDEPRFGYCWTRGAESSVCAISYQFHGHEDDHIQLRASPVNHLLANSVDTYIEEYVDVSTGSIAILFYLS